VKKTLFLALICLLAVSLGISCKAKTKPTPPPPPQAQEQPQAEQVQEATPAEPAPLSEEELYLKKTLDEINKERALKMIHFDYDKYFVRSDAKPILENNAAWLNKFATAKILIEGHCDERGTEEYNLALGEKRAKSVMDYLVSLGIPAERMRIISYGKSQPLDMGNDETAWANNRRAQFVVIEK
jgi:peptidoglycan-associated lipoprotein